MPKIWGLLNVSQFLRTSCWHVCDQQLKTDDTEMR
jgi:hypothetical protein